MSMMITDPQCAKCPERYCSFNPKEVLKKETLPQYCPILLDSKTIEKSVKRYKDSKVKDLYGPATIVEKEAYQKVRGVEMAVRPRIKELIEIAKLLNVKKIGIAFCAGLRDEASRLTSLLEEQRLPVVSVVCKCGGIDKAILGIPKRFKIGRPDLFEAACNPVLQAELLNKAKTEINVIIGLCIGHDMIFTKNSNAPVTTLIVKDRLLGHNPIIGLYSSYHKDIIESQRRT